MWLKGGNGRYPSVKIVSGVLGNGRCQCRFAEAGRGGDKGKFVALVELFVEMGAGDGKRP